MRAFGDVEPSDQLSAVFLPGNGVRFYSGERETGEFDVASGADGFGLRGNALEAEANRARAFAHDAAGE